MTPSRCSGKGSRPSLRLAPLPPRRPVVKPLTFPAPLWVGYEPWSLEPLACQRAWQLRQLREPYRTEELEKLLRGLRAKWLHAVEPDWALIDSELRVKAARSLSAEPSVAAEAPKKILLRRGVAKKDGKPAMFLNWLVKVYRTRKPLVGKTDEALAREFERDSDNKGIKMSVSSVRRAFKRKK
jgi:hypothetical protein